MEEQLEDVAWVSRRLKVPKSWVYQHAETGMLPSRKVGKYRRFVPSEIEEFIEGRRQGNSNSDARPAA